MGEIGWTWLVSFGNGFTPPRRFQRVSSLLCLISRPDADGARCWTRFGRICVNDRLRKISSYFCLMTSFQIIESVYHELVSCEKGSPTSFATEMEELPSSERSQSTPSSSLFHPHRHRWSSHSASACVAFAYSRACSDRASE